MGFGANSGFDFTRELKEILRKKIGFGSTVDLILYWNRTNCEEKKWDLEPMMDLILLGN